jgi:hypothetical protein
MKPQHLPEPLASLAEEPAKAVERLKMTLAKVRRGGQERHVCLDCLVPLLLDEGDLDLAEKYALELVEIDEDATHVTLLGRTYEAKGDGKKAQLCFEKARDLPERHLDEYGRQLLAEAGLTPPGRKPT